MSIAPQSISTTNNLWRFAPAEEKDVGDGYYQMVWNNTATPPDPFNGQILSYDGVGAIVLAKQSDTIWYVRKWGGVSYILPCSPSTILRGYKAALVSWWLMPVEYNNGNYPCPTLKMYNNNGILEANSTHWYYPDPRDGRLSVQDSTLGGSNHWAFNSQALPALGEKLSPGYYFIQNGATPNLWLNNSGASLALTNTQAPVAANYTQFMWYWDGTYLSKCNPTPAGKFTWDGNTFTPNPFSDTGTALTISKSADNYYKIQMGTSIDALMIAFSLDKNSQSAYIGGGMFAKDGDWIFRALNSPVPTGGLLPAGVYQISADGTNCIGKDGAVVPCSSTDSNTFWAWDGKGQLSNAGIANNCLIANNCDSTLSVGDCAAPGSNLLTLTTDGHIYQSNTGFSVFHPGQVNPASSMMSHALNFFKGKNGKNKTWLIVLVIIVVLIFVIVCIYLCKRKKNNLVTLP